MAAVTTPPTIVLVPLREHRLLVSTRGSSSHMDDSNKDDADVLPYIPLSQQQHHQQQQETTTTTESSTTTTTTTIGRIELLQTMWKACGCAPASRGKGTTTNKCSACLITNAWVKRYLPRNLLQFKVDQLLLLGNNDNNNSSSSSSSSSNTSTTTTATTSAVASPTTTTTTTTLQLQVRVSQQSVYPIHKCIHILRKQQPTSAAATTTTTDTNNKKNKKNKTVAYTLQQLVEHDDNNHNHKSTANANAAATITTRDDKGEWLGPITLQPNDVLQFVNPRQQQQDVFEFRVVALTSSTATSSSTAACNTAGAATTIKHCSERTREKSNTLMMKQSPFLLLDKSPPTTTTNNDTKENDCNPQSAPVAATTLEGNALETAATTTTAARTSSHLQSVLKSYQHALLETGNEDGLQASSSSSSHDKCNGTAMFFSQPTAAAAAAAAEKEVHASEETQIISNPQKRRFEEDAANASSMQKSKATMSQTAKKKKRMTTAPDAAAVHELNATMPQRTAAQAATTTVSTRHLTAASANDDGKKNATGVALSKHQLVKDKTNAATNQVGSTATDRPYILYFVRKGTDMSNALIDGNDGLKAHVIARGAQVVEVFNRSATTRTTTTTTTPLPTHLVCSNHVKPESIASALGFASIDELTNFLQQHDIKPVQRKWAARGNRILKPPMIPASIRDIYRGLRIKPLKKQPPPAAAAVVSRPTPVADRNRVLADLFKKLSKLYQLAPIDGADEWRAYSFMKTSCQLRYLDFDVTCHPSVLDKVKKTKQFGATALEIIEHFLETGTCERMDNFQRDPRRRAMQMMMEIWGVGRVKATELVKQGYETIEQVRAAVDTGKLTLDRNQYIGLLCYEDIQDEMSRDEAERIHSSVRNAVEDRYPSAQCTIMGSYRRGKETCGDVDILITHPNYENEVPPNALGRIVDDLMSAGHIAHHLTFISGMEHTRFESLPQEVAAKLTRPESYGRNRNKKAKVSSSSYMGVFKSPYMKGKLRRVDIKFYPYRERVFASLYFTGNGYFNRAMRLWAKQKMFYHLDDHGLFQQGTSERVMEAQTEKEVFDKLGYVRVRSCHCNGT